MSGALGQDDAALTALLGPKCPGCGWRGGQHRMPATGDYLTACPEQPKAASQS